MSQMIVSGLMTLIQAVLLFAVLLAVFNMPNEGNILYILAIVLMQIWCGISFGKVEFKKD